MQPWTCPGCTRSVVTPFCPTCGERPVTSRDLTVRGLLAQFMKVIGGLDGRLARSLRMLLARPGFLTLEHGRGLRKPYIGPFQLFIFANVVFFASQSLLRIEVLSSPLDSHLNLQDWRSYAQPLVAGRLAASGKTLALFEPAFNHAVAVNAKSLVVLMTLPFAALLPLVFYARRLPVVTHVVFTLHAYAFLLLLLCVGIAIAAIHQWAGGVGLQSARVDNVVTLVLVGAFGVYLHVAIGKVYQVRGWPRPLAAAALAVGAGFIMLGYRFVIFMITLYTT